MTLEYQKSARKRYIKRKQKEHGLESFESILDEEESKREATWLDNPPMPTKERAKIAKERKKTEEQLGIKRGKR